jgi:hypothetical protein
MDVEDTATVAVRKLLASRKGDYQQERQRKSADMAQKIWEANKELADWEEQKNKLRLQKQLDEQQSSGPGSPFIPITIQVSADQVKTQCTCHTSSCTCSPSRAKYSPSTSIKFLSFDKRAFPLQPTISPDQAPSYGRVSAHTSCKSSIQSRGMLKQLQNKIPQIGVNTIVQHLKVQTESLSDNLERQYEKAKIDSKIRHQEYTNRDLAEQRFGPPKKITAHRLVDLIDEVLDCWDPFYSSPEKEHPPGYSRRDSGNR